jgi:hypothetical protein
VTLIGFKVEHQRTDDITAAMVLAAKELLGRA